MWRGKARPAMTSTTASELNIEPYFLWNHRRLSQLFHCLGCHHQDVALARAWFAVVVADCGSVDCAVYRTVVIIYPK